MKHFKFECINKPINNDVIKEALKYNFTILLGGRSNGKKYFCKEYERLKKHEQKTSI